MVVRCVPVGEAFQLIVLLLQRTLQVKVRTVVALTIVVFVQLQSTILQLQQNHIKCKRYDHGTCCDRCRVGGQQRTPHHPRPITANTNQN